MPHKTAEARRAYHRRYMRDRRRADPEFREKANDRRRKNDARYREQGKAVIAEFRADGCQLCGEPEECCLSAHHIDPSEKEFTIGNMVRDKMSAAKIAQELEKCICLCHNCHAKVHAGLIELPAS